MFGIDDAVFWPAAASLVGGLLTHEGAEDTNAANSAQAANQMAFQREMSNTSYQRAVEDMKKAGLNPMLAYSQGGATTPGGAMAQMQNALGQGVSSAQVGAKVIPEVKQMEAQAAKVEADTDLSRAEATRSRTQALVDMAMVPKIEQETRTSGSSASHFGAMADRLKLLAPLEGNLFQAHADESRTKEWGERRRVHAGGPEAEVRELVERAALHGAHRGLTSTESELKGLQLPRARNEAEAQRSWFMREVGPYVDYAHKSGASASDLFRMSPAGRTFYRGRP